MPAANTSAAPLIPWSLEDGPERTVARLLDEATRRLERWMAIIRSLVMLVTLIRFVAFNGLSDGQQVPLRTWIPLWAAVVMLAFSLWVFRRARRGRISTWVLGLSVTVDAMVCFSKLLPNALWPAPGYAGILAIPDWAMLLLVLTIAGFRLSARVVWLSAALCFASIAILVYIDHLVLGARVQYAPGNVVLTAIYVGFAAALALIIARQTRALVIAGARESLRGHRAQQALGGLLHDNHDVRSLISAANLTSELVVRGLEPGHPQRRSAESLCEDLHAVSTLMSTLRERAFQGLAAAEGHLDAEMATAVHAVTALVSRRFAAVQIAREVPDGLRVRLAGGMVILERVLLNIIVNACEGDGARAAANLWIRAWPGERSVHLRIEDDGPGFPEDILRAPRVQVATTKRDGSGFGLFLVHSVIAASQGQLALSQRAGGGACVELVLPAREA